MAEVKRPRRYYLHKRIQARESCDDTELSWRAKQEAEPGTPLPATFPLLSQLAAAGYTTKEDLDGADTTELERIGLRKYEATSVLSALAAL